MDWPVASGEGVRSWSSRALARRASVSRSSTAGSMGRCCHLSPVSGKPVTASRPLWIMARHLLQTVISLWTAARRRPTVPGAERFWQPQRAAVTRGQADKVLDRRRGELTTA